MLILDEIVSADGFAAKPDGSIDWFERRDGVIDASGYPSGMAAVAAVLLGRATYENFSSYWPSQNPMAPVNALPKHVVSATLTDAPWGELAPATVERGDLAAIVERLEDQYADAPIVVWGSLSLASTLLSADLVDEVWLRTIPVALGAGRTFWPVRDIELRRTPGDSSDVESAWGLLRYRLQRRPA